MMGFLKFLFHLTIRLVIVFGAIGVVIFLLWGALYLLFVE